jgi:DNA-binding winged helix-turn-helix (wHTH) protein
MPQSTRYTFAAFELDLTAGTLRKNGEPVRIGPQAFRALALLVTRAGELVTREELQKEIWGDRVHVEFEHGLNECIRQVRATVGVDAKGSPIIVTRPREGYRLAVPVHPGIDVPWWSLRRWHAAAAGVALVAAGYLVAPAIMGSHVPSPSGFYAAASNPAQRGRDLLSKRLLPLPVSFFGMSPIRGTEVAQPVIALKSARSYEEGAYHMVEGEVTNLSDESLRDVRVVTTWYAEDGTVIIDDDAPLRGNHLGPGQSSSFKTVTSTDPRMSRFSVSFQEPVGGTINSRDDRSTLVHAEVDPAVKPDGTTGAGSSSGRK